MSDTHSRFGLFTLLARPLWQLSPGERKKQRCELAVALPFAALGGAAYGAFWARQAGAAAPGIVPLAAAGLCVGVYLQITLTPPVAHLVGVVLGEGLEPLGPLLWDGVSGAGAAFLATRFLGVGVLPAVALAGAIGAVYAGVLSYGICGRAAADLVGILSGSVGGGRSRPSYSYPASLADRGHHEEALLEYERLVEADPSDPAPYLLAARVVRESLRDFEAEARWLGRARERARLSDQQELHIGRRLVDLWRTDLGDPRRAAPELARLAERFPETDTGAWARTELALLKSEIARELELEAEGRLEPGDPP